MSKVVCKTMIMLCCALLMFSGCAVNQRIKYNLNDISPADNSAVNTVSLSVEYFDDDRKNNVNNDILFADGHQTRFQDKSVYVNSEKHYLNPLVPIQIATVITDHMNKRAAFNSVMTSSRTLTDFYLVGRIKDFYGRQDYSRGAVIGAQFGLIGALATAGIKSDGTVRIGFSDIKVYAKDGNLVKEIGEISEIYNEQLPVDAYGWCIYFNVNEKLKNVVNRLADEVEKAVSEHVNLK